MLSSHKTCFNGKLVALFLFQFSLLIPFMRVLEPKLLIAFFSSFFCVLILYKNKSLVINSRVFLVYFLVLFLFLIKWLIGQAEDDVFFTIFMYITPVLFLFLYPFSYKKTLKTMFILSKIGFLLLFWLPFSSQITTSYMRFGYGMVPIVILSYVEIKYYKYIIDFSVNNIKNLNKVFNFIIVLVGSLEILLYGARGCTFSLLVFIFLDYFLLKSFSFLKSALLFICLLTIYFNIEWVFDVLDIIVSKFGVFSYSLLKFKRQLLYGFENAASGRLDLYTNAVEDIFENPLFGGNISISETYVHNLFLQVGSDFGIFAVLIMILFLIYVLHLICSQSTTSEEKILLVTLFSISFGRLMFSSTIWQRPEFWMLVFCVFSFKHNKEVNKKVKDY